MTTTSQLTDTERFMHGTVRLDDAERAEHARLKELKAWGTRFFELDRRLSAEATDRWRQQNLADGGTFEEPLR